MEYSGYRIINTLHQSFTTLIFKAFDDNKQKHVCIKTNFNEYPSVKEINGLLHEYSIMQKLMNPDQVLLKKWHQKTLLVYDYFEGKNLAQLYSHLLPIEQFFPLALEIIEKLREIQDKNIIHKCLNPYNILYNPQTSEAKIIDFALAVETDRESQQMSVLPNSDSILPYISPEQTGRINRYLDYRTDFYSLGMTFYRLLTGVTPFHADNAMGWIHSHIAHKPLSIGEINSSIPEMVNTIIQKLLAKNSEDRYLSFTGLIHDLSECQKQYEKDKKIVSFSPGMRDRAKHFQISKKIFGRDREGKILTTSINGIRKGKRKLLTISGPSGIGKTAFVQEYFSSFDHQKITFIQGKFEQYNQNRPYSAVIDALNGLVKNILCENDEKLEIWRRKILDVIGDEGSLILEILPDLAKVIDQQEEKPRHSIQELQLEFFQTMERFIRLFALHDHPLILFIDDMQWSDLATRDLISSLVRGKNLAYFCFILSYRDNVSTHDHTFLPWLTKISKLVPIKSLVLSELDQFEVNRMVAATMKTGEEEVKPLATVIYSKTKGNPFFLSELLNNLHQNGYIYFSSDANCWQWNIETIRQLSVCENVVDFMVTRLKELPEKTKTTLMHGACVGPSFDLKILSHICTIPPIEVYEALEYAVKENVIVSLGNTPDSLEDGNLVLDETKRELESQTRYQFQHNRIQQVIYSMLKANMQKNIHRKIAIFLKEQLTEVDQDELFISAVNHYNKSWGIIEADQEKYDLAEMNSLAAQKMEAAFAFTVAKKYLETGLTLLKNNTAPNSSCLALKMKRDYFYILYLCKDIKSALSLSRDLLHEPLSENDQAQILYLCSQLYNTIGENEAAMDAGLEGLACLGHKFPPVIKRKDVIYRQQELDRKLLTHPISDLVNLPKTNNRSHELAQQILCKAYLYTIRSTHLCNYLIIYGVESCLSHGLTSNAPFLLINYAKYTGIELQEWKKALALAEIAVSISKIVPNPYIQSTILFRLLTISFWNKRHFPFDNMLDQIKDATEIYGNTLLLAFTVFDIYFIITDLNLAQQIEEGNSYLKLIKEAKSSYVWPMMKICVNQRKNLIKAGDHRFSLGDDEFKIQHYLRKFRKMEKAGDTLSMSVYHLNMLMLCYIFGKNSALHKHIRQPDATMGGDPFLAEHCFYTFLALCRIYSKSSPAKKKILKIRMSKELKKMKSWSNTCPQRFLHRYLLMQAEMTANSGKDKDALPIYNQAIHAAHENGFMFDEALINEQVVHFLCTHYNEKMAYLYLSNAHNLYHCYGAFEKTKHLEETYPQLIHEKLEGINRAGYPNHYLISATNNMNTHFQSQDLDIIALSKTVNALSEEVILENLLHKLMKCIHETSGAERSLLLLQEEDQDLLLVQAEISIQRDITVMQSTPYDQYPNLSTSIIQYVIRSLDTVLLENAAHRGDFTHDPVIQQEQTKSLLCLPIINQQKLIGILYLNNNVTTHAFSISHLETLKIIIAQAAITIRNANLYYNLEKKVAERTKEINKLNQQLKERIVDRTEKLEHAKQEILAQEYKCELADVTSGTLHNVKNILNSIKVSGEMIRRYIKGNSYTSLKKANTLLRKHLDSLEDFIRNDPKGKMLMKYYFMIEKELTEEHTFSEQHINRLDEKIDAIEKIVVTQQGYSGTSYLEELSLLEIIEDALIMQSESLERHQIKVNKQFQAIPPVIGIKTKVMHILINLIKNAREAMTETPFEKKSLNLSTYTDADFCCLRIQDSGCGIVPEHLEKVFTHGFTTKKNGHGFGLYSCAAYMQEMKGTINLESEGVDKGTTFTLQFARK